MVPEKIRSISGANKRRHSADSESEPEEEPSSSEEEKEEQKQELKNSSAGDLSTADKPEEGVKKAVCNQRPAGPSAPVCQAAPNKSPCKPAVFIPVDRSPEIQVRLCEPSSAYQEGWRLWYLPSNQVPADASVTSWLLLTAHGGSVHSGSLSWRAVLGHL